MAGAELIDVHGIGKKDHLKDVESLEKESSSPNRSATKDAFYGFPFSCLKECLKSLFEIFNFTLARCRRSSYSHHWRLVKVAFSSVLSRLQSQYLLLKKRIKRYLLSLA